MVTSYGMSEELGPVTIGEKAGEVFLGASLQELGSVGPATLELIDREVERIVGDSVAQGEAILRRNWSAVYETANALVEHETLSGRGARRGALDGAAGPARLGRDAPAGDAIGRGPYARVGRTGGR